MAKAQPTRESGREKMTAAVQAHIDQAEATTVQTVLVIPRLRAPADVDARAACQKILREHFATRPAELLAQATRRYGQGTAFAANLRDSRMELQHKMVGAAPRGQSLWLADAVAVSGTRSEIEDFARHEEVEAVDVNPTFTKPEVLRTPLEDTPQAIDGTAWGVAKIGAPHVWGGYGRGAGIIVGHLDTGVDGNHAALNGRIAAFREIDALGGLMPPSAPFDSDEHGTHTAGTICGRSFRGTNLGVAPEARLASALVLPGGSGTFAQIIGGMQWAIGEGAQIISMSLGGFGYTTLWNLPVLNATIGGVLVCASIGNSGQGTTGGPGNDLFAVGVGATHYQDAAAGFSSGQTLAVTHTVFGNLVYMKPDISAPGVQVVSSIPGNEVASFNGTSMACPHVAGTAALLLSAAPTLAGNPLGVRSVMLGTVEDYGDAGRDQRFGFGRLDALAAAQQAVAL